MGELRRVAVFCGSSAGTDPQFAEAARELGRLLADRSITLVYGGGHVGLMGQVADAVLGAGGSVIGVITDRLRALELAHPALTELLVVDSLHARKMVMASLSDAFVGLPGGFGTLDELMDVVTWTQLGYHEKPVGLCNTGGYYDALMAFVDGAIARGFVREAHRGLLLCEPDPRKLMAALAEARLPTTGKWAPRA
jgi:uncharacterized protein (TIGR00730 family)